VVEVLIGKWVVDDHQFMPAQQAKRVASPFPIAYMSHHHDDAFACCGVFLEQGICTGVEFAAFNNTFFADGEYFESFYHKIAQVVVEGTCYFADLLFRFFGEGIAEILKYYCFAIPEAIVQYKTDKIGNGIEHRKG
jgi:hypothetical protein